ncbi:hypothetical protein L211DRAFT_843674, partial [Terfezia boudieri ATCC MYA-4762]
NPPNNPTSQKGMELVHPDRAAQIATPPTNRKTQVRTQAVVLHAAPTKYKPSLMRKWIEEDNKNAQIKGIRWLLLEGRRVGKAASSLVIYLLSGRDRHQERAPHGQETLPDHNLQLGPV